jgi:diguanylate cyclase (GGDEF)-like protein/PAS domain S-box-containing protein
VPGDPDALRAIVEASDDELFSLDGDWRYTAFNAAHAAAVRARHGVEIAIGGRPVEPADEPGREAIRDIRERVLAGEHVLTEVSIGHSGDERRYETLLVPLPGDEAVTRGATVRARDVTEEHRAREALRQSEEEYRLIADFTHDWEAWRDPEGRYRYVSPSCRRITGHSAEEFVDDPMLLERIAHPDDREALRAHLASTARHAHDDRELVFRVLRPDGDIRWIGHACTAVYGGDGSWLGRRESNRDITERRIAETEAKSRSETLARLNEELIRETATLAEANAAIARLARTDDLTGVANRRHFFETAGHTVSLARRQHLRLALLSLDLDGFKRVNDTEGHAVGDEVLCEFARILTGLCRAEDLPARVGGDEFCVLLPGITLDGAAGLAQRTLAAARSSITLRRHGVTVSAGAAEWLPDESAGDLLRRGDDALYTAKRAGGDRLAVHGEGSGVPERRPTWRTQPRPRGRVI